MSRDEIRAPDFAWTKLWAQLRLLHGLKTGRPLEAARDVRQLAWLAYRTDSLLGALWAIDLLRLERQAYDSMESPPREWHPMSHEQLLRLRGILFTSPSFSSLAAPAETAKRARHCGAPAVSGCIGLSEASITLRWLKPIAEQTYPEAYAAHAEDLATMPCATSTARFRWERVKPIDEDRNMLRAQPRWLDFAPASYAWRYEAGSRLRSVELEAMTLRRLRSYLESGSYLNNGP